MIIRTWINLPVKDVTVSVEFFEELGFKLNDQFNATNVILNDNTMITLVEKAQFEGFSQKQAPDTDKAAELALVVQAENRDSVNELVDKAISLGAKETREPHGHGPMFGRSFEDLDGHIWEVFSMDE